MQFVQDSAVTAVQAAAAKAIGRAARKRINSKLKFKRKILDFYFSTKSQNLLGTRC